MAAGILCELVLGIALGTSAALKRGGLADRLLMAFLLYRCFGAAVHRRDAFSIFSPWYSTGSRWEAMAASAIWRYRR